MATKNNSFFPRKQSINQPFKNISFSGPFHCAFVANFVMLVKLVMASCPSIGNHADKILNVIFRLLMPAGSHRTTIQFCEPFFDQTPPSVENNKHG